VLSESVLDQVSDLIREVADTIVRPRFRHLTSAQIHAKAPGDVVTIADQESERALTAGLTALLPGSQVVGEEAVAADPGILRRMCADGDVWIVDPVDGTNNFAAGKTPFAIMVALLREGEAAASWILDVMADRMAIAEAGSGAYLDGVRVKTRTDDPGPAALRGTLARHYFPADLRERVNRHAGEFAEVTNGHHCAGYEYPSVATDEQQFAMFWRILPWDHVPGTLFVRESGGVVRHLDGTEYHPAGDGDGLLVAPNPDVWETVRSTLFD
jgi:fructose-1,6-bisphosphatase/inositol monophosphatase family enzyme